MKIIRFFSKSLRHFDIELAKRASKGVHDEDNPDNLYHIGEYYYKNGHKKIAAYIFVRYIELHPQGTFIAETKERLQALSEVELSNKTASANFNRVYKTNVQL